ncbi:MAG: class I SAM-dependent methyltransferase [Candidatus Omnitrophota bacterium]|jgi:ubiquinone/menaquinone biosynthesis C-methylase UbiE
MKKDYISVVYDQKRTPVTGYPVQLASYLVNRFGINKNAKLLEIGCGRGDFLGAFCGLGLECYGVDISDHCSKSNPALKVACLDVSKDDLPYADNTFDVVYHKSVLEHINNPDHLMKETSRVLKRGGRIIILTPDWVSQMKVFYEDFTHSRPYDRTSLQDLLKIYGFLEARTELFCQLPVLWKYPALNIFGKTLRLILDTPRARALTKLTGIKFFRWSVELMVLGTGINDK